MDYCRSSLEPACPPQADSEGRWSTRVRFSRGGGVLYRIAGVKSHRKKSKPAGFPYYCAFGSTLFPGEKCQAGASGLMITSNFINAPLSSPFKGGLRDIQLETSRGL